MLFFKECLGRKFELFEVIAATDDLGSRQIEAEDERCGDIPFKRIVAGDGVGFFRFLIENDDGIGAIGYGLAVEEQGESERGGECPESEQETSEVAARGD